MVEFALVAPIFFLIIFAILEAGRFVFFYQMLSSAAREGARYAIVHGSASACPTGPMPAGQTNPCGADASGERVKEAVSAAAIGLVDEGDLFVDDPVWTPAGSALPARGASSSGDNSRGSYVTVFVEYTYNTLVPIFPPITISAESSLVINH